MDLVILLLWIQLSFLAIQVAMVIIGLVEDRFGILIWGMALAIPSLVLNGLIQSLG